MIKATDLRIGNIVFSAMIDESFKVSNLTTDYDPLCKPIEITEEWVLKFGFEKQENNWKKLCICNDWTYLYWERLTGLELSVNKHSVMQPHIKYVHQLQNLYYALTGVELSVS